MDAGGLYFNDTTGRRTTATGRGPRWARGPYATITGGPVVRFAVPASGRVGGVAGGGGVERQPAGRAGRGRWWPLELARGRVGCGRGALNAVGTSRVTYVVQAVDERGNVTWLEWASAELPSRAGSRSGYRRPRDGGRCRHRRRRSRPSARGAVPWGRWSTVTGTGFCGGHRGERGGRGDQLHGRLADAAHGVGPDGRGGPGPVSVTTVAGTATSLEVFTPGLAVADVG